MKLLQNIVSSLFLITAILPACKHSETAVAETPEPTKTRVTIV